MKLLTCPLNGPRNIDEFQYLGPLRPDLAEGAADADWAAHLFRAENRPGPMVEWWRHTPSNTVFLAERHTLTDTILRTWLPGAKP
ncbi:MAG: sarcosine oxidase subunit delta [Paracoccaceae bacterium]|nr:MAG: sarcosine oxidase subunit delta [Paracoccaceae bacterium]